MQSRTIAVTTGDSEMAVGEMNAAVPMEHVDALSASIVETLAFRVLFIGCLAVHDDMMGGRRTLGRAYL